MKSRNLRSRIASALFWAAIIATLVWVFAREHSFIEGGVL
jgi:hypothetical protein